jgi:DNA polymerase-3 subunit delta
LNAFREIEQDLKNGAADGKRVFLLCGKEAFLVHHYENVLAGRFGGGAGAGLDTSVFYGTDKNEDDIAAACETFPMFAPYRLVLVKGAGDVGKKLAGLLGGLPEQTKLIFTAGAAKKTMALYKEAAKHGAVYDFDRLGETDLENFAAKRFKRAGLAIMPTVLTDFLARTGYLDRDAQVDLFKVDGEATKLICYCKAESRNEITRADLDACMGVNLQTDVFALVDAISAGRKAEAVRMLEYRLESGESAFALLPRIIDQFETMVGVKELEAKKASPQRMLELLPVRYDWQLKKLRAAAARLASGTLYGALHKLYNIEPDIRSGNIPERLALTLFIAEL